MDCNDVQVGRLMSGHKMVEGQQVIKGLQEAKVVGFDEMGTEAGQTK